MFLALLLLRWTRRIWPCLATYRLLRSMSEGGWLWDGSSEWCVAIIVNDWKCRVWISCSIEAGAEAGWSRRDSMERISKERVQEGCPGICIFLAITIHLNINSLSYFIQFHISSCVLQFILSTESQHSAILSEDLLSRCQRCRRWHGSFIFPNFANCFYLGQ